MCTRTGTPARDESLLSCGRCLTSANVASLPQGCLGCARRQGKRMGVLRTPVALALARNEREVPGPDPRWAYEPKFDGWLH
jgi:hypothetical protein